MFSHPIFTLFISLFLLMDAIGNIPLFIALLKKLPVRRQRVVILRELFIALLTILLFFFLGDFFLKTLGVTEETVRISGGIILMLIAIKMIFPSHQESQQPLETEPFIVPLAIPLIAGPAILASVMIYSRQSIPTHYALIAIVGAWVCSTIILLLAPYIQKILGQRGIDALERLMGLILMLLAIQMFLNGISGFIACQR